MLNCLGLPTLQRSAAYTGHIHHCRDPRSIVSYSVALQRKNFNKSFFLSAPFAVQFVAHIPLLSEYICAH